MITFKFTFLLAFNAKSDIKVESKKPKTGRNEEKEKLLALENLAEPKKDYELTTGNFITNVRIEYELLPKKFKYGIDILCWQHIAKISTSDACVYYRTIKSGDMLWVPLTIHHFVNEMTEDELINLYGHIITFNISSVKKDITLRASPFYCMEAEVNSEEFVEYFEDDPNKYVKHRAKINEIDELNRAASKCTSSDCIGSWLKFTGKTHCYMVYDTISSLKKNKRIKYREFIAPSEPVATEKKKDTKQKGTKKEEKKKDPYFIIPGEVFYTDPKLAIFKLKESNNFITTGFIYLSVQNLMTRDQKISLNPFIVKIKTLKCLPADLLKKHGYNKIFISYEIPNFVNYDSPAKPIEETVYFDDCHAYFTKDVPKINYLEFIRSERLKVEIKGIKEEERRIKPALFGTKKEDENFSKRLLPREAHEILRREREIPKTEILAIAPYDISSLLKNVWIFKQEAFCYHPDHLLHGVNQKPSEQLADVHTITEVNLGLLDKEKSTSPLLGGILAAACTTLDMEFYFVAPQFATFHLQKNRNSFKRLFFTVYNRSLAHHLLASIIQHNENLLGFNAILIDTVHFSEEKVKIELKKRRVSKQQQASDESLRVGLKGMVQGVDDVITGFVIDSGNEVNIFAEGISHGYILEIWNKIHKANTNIAKIFLNSVTDFENRLYDYFIATGIYIITLKKPLAEILKEQNYYIEGSMPIPCFQALQKLNILFQTTTLRKMIEFNLFPQGSELVSFNLEFGVPLRMYK